MLTALLLVLSMPVVAQETEDNLGNWLMYFGANKLNDKWSVHTEVQYRNAEFAPNTLEQLLLRTGVNYRFLPHAMVTAGYGHITAHDPTGEEGSAISTEHRIWQQLITTQQLGRIKLEHRYRIEQRWITLVGQDRQYKDRLRYRLFVAVPLSVKKGALSKISVLAYNELFMNTQDFEQRHYAFFDRNRLYAGFGYQFNPNLVVQVGLLRQRIGTYVIKNVEGKWFGQFGVVFNPRIGKKESAPPE